MSDEKLDMILTALTEFRSDFDEFKKENQKQSEENKKQFKSITEQLARIEETTIRLEEGQPQDITAILDRINKKLDERDDELQVLNNRLFKTESKVERLTRQ